MVVSLKESLEVLLEQLEGPSLEDLLEERLEVSLQD